MEEREKSWSRPLLKKKNKNSNERASLLRSPDIVSKRSTQFTVSEIKERANLFKLEYNQEDLHDRVLVLQVMPDDYEVRELTARLELNECASTSVNDEVKSKRCGEIESEVLPSGFSTFTNTVSVNMKEKLSKQSSRCFGRPSSDNQLFGSTSKCEIPSSTECWKIHKPDDTERNVSSVAEESRSESKAGEDGMVLLSSARNFTLSEDAEIVQSSSWSESKTERNDGGPDNSEELYVPDMDITMRIKETKHCMLRPCYSTAQDDSEPIVFSEGYSMPEVSIAMPPTMNTFPEADHGLPENESGLKLYTGNSDDSGSSLFGDSIVESESVHDEIELDDDDTSASARDLHVLREHRIYVHACWLAVNSRYFRSLLFESGMRECSSAEFCMKVTESEENAFLLLLKSIYDAEVLENLDIAPLMNVLRLSVKFDARFPALKARRVLEAMPLTLEVCETIIEAVNSGGLPDLGGVMKNVELWLLSEFEPLDDSWESEKFASLSEPALRFILGSDRLVVQSENTVFIALMKWIAKNAEVYERMSEYSDLLNLIRFEVMKPTYIYDVVRGHEIAKQLDNFDAVYLKAITNHALPQKRREICTRNRNWCIPKTPTFMWILYPEPEMFSFDEKITSNSTVSSSFWYFGYKMHLRLDLSTSQDETSLYLVVENLVEDGSVELAYDVEVKFGEGLHRSFTCDPFVYQGNARSPPPGNYPFDERYSVDEIREILLGSSIRVAVTFEITVEKLLND